VKLSTYFGYPTGEHLLRGIFWYAHPARNNLSCAPTAVASHTGIILRLITKLSRRER